MASHATLRREKSKKPVVRNSHKRITVAEYLLKRLNAFGIRHLFSLTHPHLERFHHYAENNSKIFNIDMSSSLALTHAADGYGKTAGFSALALTKESPGFIDALIRASYESVAEVFILGTKRESISHPFDSQDHIEKGLRNLTAGWTVLDDPKVSAKKIDRIIDYCLHYQKPVCIELAQEIADECIPPHTTHKTEFQPTDPNSLSDFLLDLDELLSKAKHPGIFVGRESIAHHVEDDILHFAKRYNIPIIQDTPAAFDLLLTFSERMPKQISYSHKVHLCQDAAFCDERRYSDIYFKDAVEALSLLESRKYYKPTKERSKVTTAKLQILEDIAKGYSIVTGPKFSLLFARNKQLITTDTHLPTYCLEAGIGIKMANPNQVLLAIIDENELHSSLSALQFAEDHNVKLVICVIDGMCARSTDPFHWNLTELAHLFVDGKAIQVQNLKSLERALKQALHEDDGLFLIDASLL